MAFPDDPLSSQFVDNTTENAASLDAKITNQLNALRAVASLGVLGYQTSGTDVTLSGATGTAHATDAQTTVTIPYAQTVIIVAGARFNCQAGAPAQYGLQVGYNSGDTATPGSATLTGMLQTCENQGTTGVHSTSCVAFGIATLTPGDWTFYGVVTRQNNGDASDLCAGSQIMVIDAGGR